jgi:hypothetical protein
MTCQELAPLLTDYAAGAATPEERAKVERHLAGGCEACLVELVELQDAAAMLLDTEPFPAPPARLKAQLLEAIAAETTVAKPPVRSGWTLAVWAIAASLAILAAGVTWLRSPEAAKAVTETLADTWRERVSKIEQEFDVRGARLVSLPISGFKNSVVTHVLYDSVSQQLHLWATHNPLMSRTEPNRAWLLDEKGAVVARGELRHASGGRLVALLDVADLKSETAKVLLTIEADDSIHPERPVAAPSHEVVEEGVLEIR